MFKLCIFFELLSGTSVSMISVKRLNPLRSITNRFVYQVWYTSLNLCVSIKSIKHRTRQSLYHKPTQFVHYTVVWPRCLFRVVRLLRFGSTRPDPELSPRPITARTYLYLTPHTHTHHIRNTLKSNRKFIPMYICLGFSQTIWRAR